MDELIKAWTRAATAMAIYYERQNGGNVNPIPHAAAETAQAPAKVGRPRKDKTTAATAVADAPAAEAPAPVTATNDDAVRASLEEIRQLGKLYVKSFGNQTDGVAAWRGLLTKTCNVARIDDLVHADRLKVIPVIKAELAKMGAPVAAAPTPVGVEV